MTRNWSPIQPLWRAHACAHPGSILLESSLPSDTQHRSLLFTNPHEILTATTPGELPALFAAIEAALAQGHWLAGYVAYEAGTHFLDLPPSPTNGPLASFGVYDQPRIFDHHAATTTHASQDAAKLRIALMPRITVDDYACSIHQVKDWIAAGDTYQVNYTTQLQSPCPHTPLEVYEALSAQQPSSYAALVNVPNQPAFLSLSPELFFRVDSSAVITTLPMKGTAPRGSTPAEDQRFAEALRNDEKNRAEHVMIVDLLRNDLNRICRTGTVRADDLFHIEQYETLHQMTSRVSGTLQQNTSWYDVFHALFPGGSITGAPKRHTAELIQQIEQTPRGIYTGAIGYFAPDRTAAFNIAIRTAVLHDSASSRPNCHPSQSEAESKACPEPAERDMHPFPALHVHQKVRTLTLGVGGGIVADSTATSEYNEVLLKSSFAQRAAQDVHLLETMRAEQGAIRFLEAHLHRLATSAQALGFLCDRDQIRAELISRKAHGRVRLQLHRNGTFELTVSEAPAWPSALNVILSRQYTDATSPHLRHKTTYRPEYSTPTPAGFYDTLFQNTRGELTESSIATLLVQIEDRWYTPPLSSGVLPGILRAQLLQANQVKERIITLDDVQQATAAALGNALRGIAPITSLQLSNNERIHWKPSTPLPHHSVVEPKRHSA